MDLDLRKVRYFAAVAEHLNFGRAAELHIAQPVLSRQIRALEHELKMQLFERENRSTRLTPAGEALLEDARTLLPAADATRRRVRDVAAGQRTFTVGFMPGLIVTSAVRELSRRHPGLSGGVPHRLDQPDRPHPRWPGRHRVPAAARRRPRPGDRTAVQRAAGGRPTGRSRLAGKDAVTVADLAGEHLLQDPGAVPEWRDIAAELRGRQPRKAIPPLRTVEEKLEHVAAGPGIVVLPLSTATFYTRPDISHIPVRDIAPNQVCLAWDSSRRSALIHEYAAIAGALADHIASA